MITFSSLKEMVSFYSPSILGMWEASAAGHGWAKHIHHLQCELGYKKQPSARADIMNSFVQLLLPLQCRHEIAVC